MHESESGWTVTELADRMGLKPQTISGWIKAGLVSPDQPREHKRAHTIGLVGLLELVTVAELRRIGFSTKLVKRAVDNLRRISATGRPLSNFTLVVSGNDIAWEDAQEIAGLRMSVLQRPGQTLMVFPFGDQHTDVLRRLGASEPNAVAGSARSFKPRALHVVGSSDDA